MGTSTFKDTWDHSLQKDILDSIRPWLDLKPDIDVLKHLKFPVHPSFPDPIGPVKLDAIDWITRSYLTTLPIITQHIDAIEQFLENDLPQGKPFIRPQERPSVGDDALQQQLGESIVHLTERLDAIEKKLK